ncbi:MAG TPA: hypothetical protein VN963_09010 [bacterium]|nr:hypothetical protein [bacterium]
MSPLSTKTRPLPPVKKTFKKALDFFNPLPGDSPCWGLALGRKALWAVRRLEKEGSPWVEKCQRIPLDSPLFTGSPSPESVGALTKALNGLDHPKKGSYQTFQVALPDPLTRFEVFELEKVPAAGKPLREFLAWRFHQGREGEALVFTHQVFGQAEGKNLLLCLAVEEEWMKVLNESLSQSGLRVSFIDSALSYRFNFYHDLFAQNTGGGALVTLEPDYWSLGIWDETPRLRYGRSKWWNKEIKNPGDIPFKEILLEVERTLRSYVYSAKGRNVPTLFLLAPPPWREPLLKIFREGTGGNCSALNLSGLIPGLLAVPPVLSPTALAAAVKR